jgi:hypothetical protein
LFCELDLVKGRVERRTPAFVGPAFAEFRVLGEPRGGYFTTT